MDMNDPLARLIRLRASIVASTPPLGASLDPSHVGLVQEYERSRERAAALAREVGVDEDEIDAQMPPFRSTAQRGPHHFRDMTDANTAATMLRALGGHLDGVIEWLALSQKITRQQIEAAREAARQPTGFR